MTATIHYADDRLVVASLGSVLYSILRQPLTLEGVAHLRRESERMIARHGENHVSLSVIEPTAVTAVSSEVRAATSKFAGAFKILGAAIVIEGSGFRAATARTLITGIYLVTKKQYPHKVFSSIADGAAWVVPVLATASIKQFALDIAAGAESARRAIKEQ